MRSRSSRGAWLVVSLFVLGGVVLGGFFLARRLFPPAGLPYAPPDQPVRFVTYNIRRGEHGLDRVIEDIRGLRPDVLLLQEVETGQAERIASELRLQIAFRPQANLPSEGLAVLARFPLRDIVAVTDPAKRTCAVFADVVADGKRFSVASVHLQATRSLASTFSADRVRREALERIEAEWKRRGGGAAVLAGDFKEVPFGSSDTAMTAQLVDALNLPGKHGPTPGGGLPTLRVGSILCTKDWSPVAGGVAPREASDHRAVWATLERSTKPTAFGGATAAAATRSR